MNFYDVLAAKNWDGGIPTMNFFDLLFAQYMGGGEAWETYEGTLPATINANGDDMRQYQVYGATGGVGDDSGTAFGYEVDIGVKSVNLFDKSSAVVYNAYISTGDIWTNSANAKSIKIRVKPSTTYTISTFKVLSIFRIAESDDENVEPGSSSAVTGTIRLTNVMNTTFRTTSTAKVLIFQGDNNDYQDWINSLMIKEGNVIPTKHQPYYNTVTPIYIGDDPLDKDEYIDYQAGKIYRMINGTLTPTDPPVPLPALPTCEGTTIVDYAGSGTAPEKVLLEYKKGGN